MKGKFLLKHFLVFVVALIFIMVVSAVLFFILNYNTVKEANNIRYPFEIYNEITEHKSMTDNAKKIMNDNNIWAIILNKDGDIVDSYSKPQEIKNHFELTDVAKFTRWYLEGYPVFTYVYNKGLLVVGYPKDYYAKIASNYFKPDSTFIILKNIAIIVVVDLLLLFLLYSYSKRRILREVNPIRNAIKQLSRGEPIREKNCDNLADILEELIMASDVIEEKNKSKNKWLRGITHDIRTPLTIIMAYSEELDEKLKDKELKLRTEAIKTKALLINKILESLNTMYLLEDKADLINEKVELGLLIRNIAIDYINTYGITVTIKIPEDKIIILAKEVLIERLIRNIIDNSIKHNNSNIVIGIILKNDNTLIISDNGNISEQEVRRINAIVDIDDNDDNGYGILIVKKIAAIYGFDIKFEFDSGLRTIINFKN